MAKDVIIFGTVSFFFKLGPWNPRVDQIDIRSRVILKSDAVKKFANSVEDKDITSIIGEYMLAGALDMLGCTWRLDDECSEIRKMCQDALWGDIMY